MRCLVVTAHPLGDSLCAHLAGLTVRRLEAHGHEVAVMDLYAQGFAPALTAHERATYHDGFEPDGTQDHAASLMRAEALVLVFPTWWFGFPAILKGWFDRVWAPGVAFDHADASGPIRPRLHRLRHVVAVTSLGSPRWFDLLVMRQPVRRVLKHGILGACARSCRLTYLPVHGADALDTRTVQRAEARLLRAIDGLE